MVTPQVCNVEPFIYTAVPQPDLQSGASSNQINQQALENYLNRLRSAVCSDIQDILDTCCDGGGGGVESFLELTDTPDSYTGQADKFVTVKSDESGLEFSDPSGLPDDDGLTLNYSTSEQATNRTSTTGATIYQKSINFGSLPNTGVLTAAHGITGLALVIRADAWASDGTTRLPLPFIGTTLASAIALSVNATLITINAGSNRSAFTAIITLYYTKT